MSSVHQSEESLLQHQTAAVVRVASPADLPSIAGLVGEIMGYHALPPPPEDALVAALTAILEDPPGTGAGLNERRGARVDTPFAQDPRHLFLLADVNGRVVGMCALLFSVSTWSAALVCELQDVFVVEAYRGRGLGRALLSEARRLARRRGCARMFLNAEVFNLPAHAFYRALGFEEKTSLYFELPLPPED